MPNLTKKHYVAIARELDLTRAADGDPRTVALVAYNLADYFQSDNPRFDRARFLAACGVEELTAAPAVDSARL